MKRGCLGIKPGELSAIRHQAGPEYQRFDQKNNMIYQGEWNPKYKGLSDHDWFLGRVKQVQAGKPGYAREDWAFNMAATTGTSGANFVINIPDHGGTSWAPIPRSTTGGEPIDNMPSWEGDAQENTRILKGIARRFGAGDVGACLLDQRWVYSHYYDVETKQSYPIHFSDEPGYEQYKKPQTLPDRSQVIPKEMKYVLVMIYPMELEGIKTAPRLTHQATTLETYSQITQTTMAVAEFIRGLGYNAIPSSNDTAINIPLAIDAGMGELTRSAKLCHPVWGTCCRISKVITDLPLIPDTPITFGVEQFCTVCNKCAQKCPARAIPKDAKIGDQPLGEFSSAHVRMWPVDHAKCRDMWCKTGTNCGVCIATCPLNQKNGFLHFLRKSAMAKFPGLNKFIYSYDLKHDKNKTISSKEFWNHL